MTLTLVIEGRDMLDNGEAASLTLDRHGAVIGRSSHADWSLPDPKNHISARHCEISYRDGVYLLADRSTNGTYLNGSAERLGGPQPIAAGDRIQVGGYEIRVHGDDAAPATTAIPVSADADTGDWGDWHAAEPAPGWSDPPAAPAAPDAPAAIRPMPGSGGWDEPAPVVRPSAWSSEPREAQPAAADEIWGQFERESEIDWSHGDFGATAPLPVEPLPAAPAPASARRTAAPPPVPEDAWAAFLDGTGLPPDTIRSAPAQILANAGAVLRQMVSGLILMVEARARAKAQLGLQATSLELEGNNPIKFVRAPERALLQLLEPPERGFMSAARAVEDAYEDLQAHQMATIAAMRGALSSTVARFSPAAIRERQKHRRWYARLLPGAREAALWHAYEHEFEGVVQGSDEAFMDRFAKEFRTAYERYAADMRARRAGD